MKTLKQISNDNGLYYGTVYQAVAAAGILVRRRKNYEYDEKEVLLAVYWYLDGRMDYYGHKITELSMQSAVVLEAIKKIVGDENG